MSARTFWSHHHHHHWQRRSIGWKFNVVDHARPRWAVSLGVLCVFLWIVYHSKRLSRGYDVITSLAPCLFLKTHRNEASEWERESKTTRRIFALSEQLLLRLSFCVDSGLMMMLFVRSLSPYTFFFLFPHNYPMIAWLYNSFANITFFLLLVLDLIRCFTEAFRVYHIDCICLLFFDYCSHSRGHFNSCTWTRNYNKLTYFFWFCSHTREFQWILTYLSCRRWSTSSLRAVFESQFHSSSDGWRYWWRWTAAHELSKHAEWLELIAISTNLTSLVLGHRRFYDSIFLMHSVETKSSIFTHAPHSDGKWLIGDRGGWTN